MPINLSANYSPDYCKINYDHLYKNSALVLQALKLTDHSVSILFVDDDEIKWINNHYRNKNAPTNVLSFPFNDGGEDALSSLPIKELGDVFISIDTAYREAIKYNEPLHKRLTWLITHGVLHLVGYDHEKSKKDERLMFQ